MLLRVNLKEHQSQAHAVPICRSQEIELAPAKYRGRTRWTLEAVAHRRIRKVHAQRRAECGIAIRSRQQDVTERAADVGRIRAVGHAEAAASGGRLDGRRVEACRERFETRT